MRLNFMAFGDTHNNEDIAYAIAEEWEKRNKKRLHGVLFPGDVDKIAGEEKDPEAIKSMVADYYYGNKRAPYNTFFVAGNNDEWGILRWFPGGGIVGDKLYFLGRSGYLDFMGIRIAGLSGVYRAREYEKPLPTEPGFLPWQYYRKNEAENLLGLHPDILLLHQRIKVDSGRLILKKRDDFRETALRKRRDTPLRDIIAQIKPKYVFAGHEHKIYSEGRIDKTQCYGLMRVTKDSSLETPYCYKVVSLDSPI